MRYMITNMNLIRVHFLKLANLYCVFVLQKQDEKRPLQSEDAVPEKEVKKSIQIFVIDQFRYIEIHTWLRGLGNKTFIRLKMISFVLSSRPRWSIT